MRWIYTMPLIYHIRNLGRENKMKILGVITNAGAASMGLAFLWHLSNIIRFGSHYIVEPNTLTLVGEIMLILVLVVLAIIGLIINMMKLGK